MNIQFKKTSKVGLFLIGALACASFAQEAGDYRGKELKTSFRDKRIDGFRFDNAKAVEGQTDFQRSAGDAPSFRGATLSGVSFQNAVISNPDFRKADLKKVTISGADIRGANFEGANMEEANLYRATLLDCAFPKTNLKNARLDAMKVSDRADFSKADLTNASIMDVDLTEADFSDAILTNANFTRSLK